MADNSTGERTEQATPHRIRKAREEGRVPQSNEVPHALMTGTLLLLFVICGSSMYVWFVEMVRDHLSSSMSGPGQFKDIPMTLQTLGIESLMRVAPFMLGGLIAAISGGLIVGSWAFSPKALQIKFERMSPIKGMKNLISLKSLVNLLVSCVKLVVLVTILWLFIRDKVELLLSLRWMTPSCTFALIGELILSLVGRFVIVLFIISAVDMLYQKWNYRRELRMTKQEVKDETKQYELPAEVRSKIRSQQIAMSRQRMLQDVPEADVIITNPTHYAVALQYDFEEMSAPKVVAKGADLLCAKIKEIAYDNDVPIVERPELARTLFAAVEVGDAVPEALYLIVAKVLAMIYRTGRRRKHRKTGVTK